MLTATDLVWRAGPAGGRPFVGRPLVGRPIVGRWAARMRLAGVQPTATGTSMQPAGRPNFAALD